MLFTEPTFLFLFLPAGEVLVGAFKAKHSGWTFANLSTLFKQPYLSAYETSIKISLVTAFVGAVILLWAIRMIAPAHA